MNARNRRRAVVLTGAIVSALWLAWFDVARATDLGARVYVNYGGIAGKINRRILGNNIVAYTRKYYRGLYRDKGAGVWDPQRNVPDPIFLQMAKDAGITVFRWPGGTNARYLDWKASVGPVQKRQGQRFGLPEFLRFCDAVGAEPVITLSANVSAADAEDLVEYLNVQVGSGNLNGGEDWAEVRKKDGSTSPWNVRWFEFGNESFHLNDLGADSYVANYLYIQGKMKKLDPDIRIGAVLEDSTNIDSGWNKTVIDSLATQADFFVIHPYVVKLGVKAAESINQKDVALAALSADYDMKKRLYAYREAIDQRAGGRSIPLAITEYNGLFVQDRPIPYRHTLLNALHNADNMRIFLEPALNIAFAAYWQFANSYWGMVQGGLKENEPVVKQPMQYVFELYNEFLGSDLLQGHVESPSYEFKGRIGISPRTGMPSERGHNTFVENVPKEWSRRLFLDGAQSQDDGIVRVEFYGKKPVDYYHAYKMIKVRPNTLYKVTAEVRAVGLSGGKVGIAVQDARGWKHDFFQPRNTPVTGTTNGWEKVSVYFRSPADCDRIMVLTRNSPHSNLKGVAEFSSVSVERIESNAGSVQKLQAVMSRADTGEIYVLLLNKSLDSHLDVEIELHGVQSSYKAIKAKYLGAESVFSMNVPGRGSSQEVVVRPISVVSRGNRKFFVRVPRHSLTGVAFAVSQSRAAQ